MEDRAKYIGSSDAETIMSDDWSDLWARKTGRAGEPNLSRAFPVQLGKITEDFHIFWSLRDLNEETDNAYDVSKWAQEPHTISMQGVQHFASVKVGDAVIGSHPDALLRHKAEKWIAPFECKITARWGSAREAHGYYRDQCQHHLLAWGTDRLLFSVIVGTTAPERLWISPSPEWRDLYLERCQRFWWHVTHDSEPGRQAFWAGTQQDTRPPQKVIDSIPINGLKRRDLSTDNQATSLFQDCLTAQAWAKRAKSIDKELKALMQPDEGELYHPLGTLKRRKDGVIVLKLKEASAELEGSLV